MFRMSPTKLGTKKKTTQGWPLLVSKPPQPAQLVAKLHRIKRYTWYSHIFEGANKREGNGAC